MTDPEHANVARPEQPTDRLRYDTPVREIVTIIYREECVGLLRQFGEAFVTPDDKEISAAQMGLVRVSSTGGITHNSRGEEQRGQKNRRTSQTIRSRRSGANTPLSAESPWPVPVLSSFPTWL